MDSSEITHLAADSKPDCENWNMLAAAFHNSKEEALANGYVDCGTNRNGVSFKGTFKLVRGRWLGRLTPGGHTNLIKERWFNAK